MDDVYNVEYSETFDVMEIKQRSNKVMKIIESKLTRSAYNTVEENNNSNVNSLEESFEDVEDEPMSLYELEL
jgi:predicted nucleic acid-binding protein